MDALGLGRVHHAVGPDGLWTWTGQHVRCVLEQGVHQLRRRLGTTRILHTGPWSAPCFLKGRKVDVVVGGPALGQGVDA